KSIIFQVAALSMEGICVVVTPLIALMKDQVDNLKKRNIRASAIYSGMSQRQIDITLDNCAYGDYKFLYVSPERLTTELFKTRLQKMNVNLIAVDEAHCISQWGYDFRPAYLKIAELRDIVPDVPILALTATATKKVVIDIQEKLHFKKKNLFKISFERNNLIYLVRRTDDKLAYLLKIVQAVKGTGIIYSRLRKRTKEIALFLKANDISADFYHAGLSPEAKDKKQEDWKEDKIRVIVSTNAFGMGIDKPDVRFVIHADFPDSLEAYFQEAGRGGRDGKKAVAVLLVQSVDISNLKKRVAMNFPPIENIKHIYNMLGNFFQLPIGGGKMAAYDFSMQQFASQFKLPIYAVNSSLNILKLGGYIVYSEEQTAHSLVKFIVSRDDLYKIQVANAKVDSFIKLVLRNYTGLFSGYIPVDEEFLAKIGNTDRNRIYQYFKVLSKNDIIDYIPKRIMPFIQYLEERLPIESIYISKEIFKDRKERYEELINRVLYYAESSHKCRSRILMEYFGQNNAEDCGNCDVCRNDSGEKFIQPTEVLEFLLKKEMKEFDFHNFTKILKVSAESARFVLDELIADELIVFKDNKYIIKT
ncbi:MAG: RecQ family ATP-dependent DNA helicase, partial [Bacteroidales bacterium]|nr:RecQ family ATP-dependent DNA helicase [Bacteroidales bacterium]